MAYTPAQEAAERERASELGSLRRAWGDCYKIWYDTGDGVWIAERRDDRARVRRHQSWELHSEIRDDHAAKPVPQQFRVPGADLMDAWNDMVLSVIADSAENRGDLVMAGAVRDLIHPGTEDGTDEREG